MIGGRLGKLPPVLKDSNHFIFTTLPIIRSAMSSPVSARIFCDAHVHIYDCFDLDHFLDCAWSNFSGLAESRHLPDDFQGVLMLTEGKTAHWFEKLRDSQVSLQRWTVQNTEEADSVVATDINHRQILIINGRQIVTSENLEVLGLAIDSELPDGKPMAEVVKWVNRQNGIPVIPWGFGKWWGRRGRFLTSYLDSIPTNELYLGDNGGRPWFLGTPRHFKQALNDQRRILPGSDPLPFPGEECRAGSVGFFFEGKLDIPTPSTSLRSYLRNQNTELYNYMTCESLIPFVRNQTRMQIKNRF